VLLPSSGSGQLSLISGGSWGVFLAEIPYSGDDVSDTWRCGEDKLFWVPSKKGLFDVRSYYNVLVLHDNIPFP
jgi:hypothetical protein